MTRTAARCLAALATASLVACTPRLDWRDVQSVSGRYVIALPDRPQMAQREVDYDATGGPVKLALSMTSSGVGGTLFAVCVTTLPAEVLRDPARALAWFRDGLVRNIGGTLGAVRPLVAPPGAAGRAQLAEEAVARGTIGAEHRAAQLVMRLYLVDDRLFAITAIAADGELSPAALDVFLSSFRLTD
jgi:hypothetical protein